MSDQAAGWDWRFRAKLVRVLDGDTCDVMLDAGFQTYREERLRLLGVNCPEVHGATRAAGLEATRFSANWLAAAGDGWSLVVESSKSDVFGRYLARVTRVSDGACLNDDLLAAGHAVPWQRKG